ncbi:MAG: hypothetical protein A3B25_00975 [Candidatus Ryanbacteria bacterium RIFCSPLOWO2_01_FULL_48_26]|uniref:Uncharacterized protein n=1 Tax=Candidatus Ryanbacteria bacterium RIFCSPLOWO2_01_FULL_48_26 TaxID=1802126 RepID=A0A1G2GRD6_9BACT|nr:MAG: hypothetical protein A3B25_00975 [Candidatus Ryanbacteria bacterium RIFCSPLOWO2_01_FULL_48_26]
MAIVVSEEGEKKIDIVNLTIWLFLLIVVGITAYFIFFKKPELVDVASPSSYRNIDPLAQVTLNPEEVVNSPDFQSLKQYVPLLSPASVGRSNPFLIP